MAEDREALGERLRATYVLPEEDDPLLAECDVSYLRTPGPGGQHKNTTLSSVRLVHRPSGLTVIGRRERSQRRNLAAALGRLREKLEYLLTPPKARIATRPGRAAKKKRLEAKRRTALRKRDRSGWKGEPDA
jgi:protein subunit release factor A